MVTVISVQHGGTHFIRKLLELLYVDHVHYHSDTQSLCDSMDRVNALGKVLYVMRHPYQVAGTTYRRSIQAGHGADPYWLTVMVSDWFHTLSFLQGRTRVSNSLTFQVDQDIEAGDHLTQYYSLLKFLDVEPTAEANVFVAAWALEGWTNAREQIVVDIDKAALGKLNWAVKEFGYAVPEDHVAAQICWRPKGTERVLEKPKETHDA